MCFRKNIHKDLIFKSLIFKSSNSSIPIAIGTNLPIFKFIQSSIPIAIGTNLIIFKFIKNPLQYLSQLKSKPKLKLFVYTKWKTQTD